MIYAQFFHKNQVKNKIILFCLLAALCKAISLMLLWCKPQFDEIA